VSKYLFKQLRSHLPRGKIAGYILAGLGAFLFATKGVLIKLAYGYDTDATTLMLIRLSMAAPFYLLFGILTFTNYAPESIREKPFNKDHLLIYLQSAFVGILGYWCASFADFMGLKTLSPQFERLILFTYPAFVILLGAAFFKMPFKPIAMLAFAISYFGLAIVFVTDFKSEGKGILIGTSWCLVSSVSFALYLILARPLITKLGPSLFTSISMIAAALAALLHYIIVHPQSHFQFNGHVLSLGFALAIGATVLPTYLTSNALMRISSQANAVIGFINPIITLILAALVLSEKVTISDIVGTIMVLSGVSLYTYLDQKLGQVSSTIG